MKITQSHLHLVKVYSTLGILFLFFKPLKADFQLVCPPNVTVNCTDDYLHDLNVYGKAYTDYNGIIQYVHDCKTIIELDDCGNGFIKRTWGAENPENWKWFTCTQVITISNANSFRYRDIQWPQAIELTSCDPERELKNLTEPFDAPHWTKTNCAKPMVSYKDTRFSVHPGCIKLLREWKILDWCQYDPVNYPGRGVFSYTQVIKLIQTSDSIGLTCIKDTVVINNNNCDSIWINLPLAQLKSACPIYHSISNNSIYAISKNNNASGYYPNGKTQFYYLAEYACGSVQKCEVNIEIVNGIKPTPYCLPGLIVGLMPVDLDGDGKPDEGMVEVWASDLDKGSWHACPGKKLTFSFSKDTTYRSRIFTCNDVGENEVEIWVTDDEGNQDLCKTTLKIINNNSSIPDCDENFRGSNNTLIGVQASPLKNENSALTKELQTRASKNKVDLISSVLFRDEILQIGLDGRGLSPGKYKLECLDALGRVVAQKTIHLDGGYTNVELTCVSGGMVFLHLKGTTIREIRKIQRFD